MLTEFGGIAFDSQAPIEGTKNWGYFVALDGEDFARRYHDLMQVVARAPLLSGFCYTQFADTFQEVNGLLRADRSPKIPIEQIMRVALVLQPATMVNGVARIAAIPMLRPQLARPFSGFEGHYDFLLFETSKMTAAIRTRPLMTCW